MFNLHKDLHSFCNQHVSLNETQQGEMRDRRDTNRRRLKKGLEDNGNPSISYHVSQGSYAMHTMTQDDNYDYDIDDGVVFVREDLVDEDNVEITARQAREMVRNALDDGSFDTPPKSKNNCVRVHYKKGYHVDIPVYRSNSDGSLELASTEWKYSCPKEITEWYNESVIEKSPDSTHGRQMRRITKLLKNFMKSRTSWRNKMPSGLILSVLVDKCYVPKIDRDDFSLYQTAIAIKNYLDFSLHVKHPTQATWLTEDNDPSTKFLRTQLTDVLRHLEILDELECTTEDALNAWFKFFKHEYFKEQLQKSIIADRLRRGNSTLIVGAGLVSNSNNSAANTVKNTRAYGGPVRYGKGFGGPWYNEYKIRKYFEFGVHREFPQFRFKSCSKKKSGNTRLVLK